MQLTTIKQDSKEQWIVCLWTSALPLLPETYFCSVCLSAGFGSRLQAAFLTINVVQTSLYISKSRNCYYNAATTKIAWMGCLSEVSNMIQSV